MHLSNAEDQLSENGSALAFVHALVGQLLDMVKDRHSGAQLHD